MATIRKRTWVYNGTEKTAWVADYFDQGGKRRLKTFRTKKSADSWLLNARQEVKAGVHMVDREALSVAEAAQVWIEACERGRSGGHPVEPHTLRQYKQHVAHLTPLVGSEKVSTLTKGRIEELRDDLLDQHSRAMARKLLASFKSILLEGGCPAPVYHAAKQVKIKAEGRHKEHVTIPEPKQIKAILAKADELAAQSNKQYAKAWRRWRALVHTAALTGMRASELRGLGWENVDLEGGVVRVTRRADEKGILGAPKSPSARREIPIPAHLVRVLREWKIECPSRDLVFPNWEGKPELLGNIFARGWKPLLVAAKVPHFNFHLLRHYHASRLIEAGVNPKEVSVEMGHSSINITFDLYGHLFKQGSDERKARADRLAAEVLA